MMQAKPKAVVLLSGGLDSTTVLAIANASGYETYAISFSYGQRHTWELECARKIAANAGVKDHRIAQIDLRVFGGSALTADISVPKGRIQETGAVAERNWRLQDAGFDPRLGPEQMASVGMISQAEHDALVRRTTTPQETSAPLAATAVPETLGKAPWRQLDLFHVAA